MQTRFTVEALFPGYGFLWLIPGVHDFAPIRSTAGLHGLVKIGGSPAKVNNSVIDDLKAHENADGVHVIYQLHYQPGDHVRARSGPFRFYEGIIQAKTGAERVNVLFRSLDSNLTIEVETDILEPVQV